MNSFEECSLKESRESTVRLLYSFEFSRISYFFRMLCVFVRILLNSFSLFFRILSDLLEFFRVLLDFYELFRIHSHSSGLSQILLHFFGFLRILTDSIRSYLNLTSSSRILSDSLRVFFPLYLGFFQIFSYSFGFVSFCRIHSNYFRILSDSDAPSFFRIFLDSFGFCWNLS